MQTMRTEQQAFTLLEMSIVIVIIGLILGGILVGQNMIKSAELNNIMVQKEQYVSAIKQFQDKYKGLPGDIYNATSFWPEDTTGDVWSGSTGSEVENGNGDGKIAGALLGATVSPDGYEAHTAWRHLALAGLIEGEYTGAYESSGTVTVTPGVRVPKADYADNKNAGWHIAYFGNNPGELYPGKYGHALFMATGSFRADVDDKDFMAVEDMHNLDIKFDDSHPYIGNIRTGKEGNSWSAGCTVDIIDGVTGYYVQSDTECIPIFLTNIN